MSTTGQMTTLGTHGINPVRGRDLALQWLKGPLVTRSQSQAAATSHLCLYSPTPPRRLQKTPATVSTSSRA